MWHGPGCSCSPPARDSARHTEVMSEKSRSKLSTRSVLGEGVTLDGDPLSVDSILHSLFIFRHDQGLQLEARARAVAMLALCCVHG